MNPEKSMKKFVGATTTSCYCKSTPQGKELEDKGSTMMLTTYVAAALGEKACLGMKRYLSSEEIKPEALSIIELCLAESIS